MTKGCAKPVNVWARKFERERIPAQLRTFRRRAWLRAAGVTVGLPFLESLSERVRVVQAIERQDAGRFFVYYLPNGNVPDIEGKGWATESVGESWTLPDTLLPMAALKSKLTMLSGMSNSPAFPKGAGGHVAGTAGFLTCNLPAREEGTDVRGPSVDQVYADALAGTTRLKSLALGMDEWWGNDPPWSTLYARNISWVNETTPAGRIIDPPVVFDTIFERSGTGPSTVDRAKLRRSVLDQVRSEADALRVRLATTDRRKLEEYMTGLRELELQVQGSANSLGSCATGERPTRSAGDLRAHFEVMVPLMGDLALLALQCDATRVVSLMQGNGGWNEAMSFIGHADAHHSTSHHAGDRENLVKLQEMDKWEISMAARLFQKMDSIVEADGKTLLDNTQVFLSNEIADGNAHDQWGKLTLLLGGAAGLVQGTHLKFPGGFNQQDPGREHAELYVAIMQGLGLDLDAFGRDQLGPLLEVQATT